MCEWVHMWVQGIASRLAYVTRIMPKSSICVSISHVGLACTHRSSSGSSLRSLGACLQDMQSHGQLWGWGDSSDGGGKVHSKRVTWHVACYIGGVAESSPELLGAVCRLRWGLQVEGVMLAGWKVDREKHKGFQKGGSGRKWWNGM